jgi:hypothetical protein
MTPQRTLGLARKEHQNDRSYVQHFEKVADLKREGMTVFEVIAAKPTAPFDARWGQFLITPPAFTGLVYQGV